MPYPSLADFLERLEQNDEILRVDRPVEPEEPLSAIASGTGDDTKAVLLGSIRGRRFPMVGRLMTEPGRIARTIGVSNLGEAASRVEKFLPQRALDRDSTRVVKQAPVQQVVRLAGDLDSSIFPGLRLDGEEADSRITAAVVFTLDPETNERLGMVVSWTVASPTRLVPCRTDSGYDRLIQLAARYAEQKRPMPVAICLGGDPTVRLAAEAPTPRPIDPCRLGAVLRGQAIDVVACRTLDALTVPADADLIIEGFLVGAAAPVEVVASPATLNPPKNQGFLVGAAAPVEVVAFPAASVSPVACDGFLPGESAAHVLDVQAVTHRINPVVPFALPDESVIIRRTLLEAMLPWWRAELPGLADLVLPKWGEKGMVLVGSVEKGYLTGCAEPASEIARLLADHPTWRDIRLVILFDSSVDLTRESEVLPALVQHADFGERTVLAMKKR